VTSDTRLDKVQGAVAELHAELTQANVSEEEDALLCEVFAP
jgi:hypothetical protein